MPKFYMILPEKLAKYPNFVLFAQKINKIPEFYIIFARILHNNCPKNIFPRLFWGGGGGGTCPLPPSAMAMIRQVSLPVHFTVFQFLLITN